MENALLDSAEGRDADEIRGGPDLRRAVPLEREQDVVAVHSAAVVGHADELAPAVLDRDVHRGRAGVERVLHQLLDHGRGPLDDLAGRDLVGDGAGENGDGWHA